MRGRLHKLRLDLLVLGALLALAAGAVLAAHLVPLPARLEQGDSPTVLYRDGRLAHVSLSADDKWRLPVPPRGVDPDYLRALVALEDERFRVHVGVDVDAVVRAAVANARAGHVVSGASTLTMQLARLLEPRPRTLGSKVVEALRALQLELRLSKHQILTHYLRFAPFGRNVEGVEAASWAYFGHSASALSADEIATLLAVPQAPSGRYPTPRNAARLRQARLEVAGRIVARDALPRGGGEVRLTPQALLTLVSESPLPLALRPFPRQAPHAARWAQTRATPRRVLTTIDAGTQHLVERLLERLAPRARRRGIHNAAVVVVDHRSAEIRALAGGFDWYAAGHGSQIPAFASPRSTGSLIKPLIFAAAIDGGRALPRYLVTDVPLSVGAYRPRNFDGQHRGLVRLDAALARSLNVPFVRLIQQLGPEAVLGRLRGMGFAHLHRGPGHHGVAAAVGGVAATPLEVAGLYAALAAGGAYRPLRWTSSRRGSAPLALVSPGAAWLTREALRGARRGTNGQGELYWKTGTSDGHRDAWAAGSGDRYTAVVWLGNLDNASSRALVGAQAAAPLLRELLQALEQGRAAAPTDERPGDLRPLEVCAYSGRPAGEACVDTVEVWAPARRVPNGRCPFHVQLRVDRRTGEAVTPGCRASRRSEVRSFLVWPSALRRWLRRQGRAVPTLPRFAAGCTPPRGLVRPPRITSPPPRRELVLDGRSGMLPLQAETDGALRLSWFIDGSFKGVTPPGRALWWRPTPGVHTFVAVDESGQSARRVLRVNEGGS